MRCIHTGRVLSILAVASHPAFSDQPARTPECFLTLSLPLCGEGDLAWLRNSWAVLQEHLSIRKGFPALPAHLRMRPVSRGNSRRATWVGPHAERPRFLGALLRRTRGPDPSSKATLWVKATTNLIKHKLLLLLLLSHFSHVRLCATPEMAAH